MSPGAEFDVSAMMLTQNWQSDYEQLCRFDVLGLSDTAEHDQKAVYKEFREQLPRSPDGWYETAALDGELSTSSPLIWKEVLTSDDPPGSPE